MTPLSIAMLRQRVRIELAVRTADGVGGAAVNWTSVGEVWASVGGTAGGERVSADGLGGRVSHRVILRHRDDLLPGHRLIWRGRILDIRAILDRDGQRRRLECLCEERVP